MLLRELKLAANNPFAKFFSFLIFLFLFSQTLSLPYCLADDSEASSESESSSEESDSSSTDEDKSDEEKSGDDDPEELAKDANEATEEELDGQEDGLGLAQLIQGRDTFGERGKQELLDKVAANNPDKFEQCLPGAQFAVSNRWILSRMCRFV